MRFITILCKSFGFLIAGISAAGLVKLALHGLILLSLSMFGGTYGENGLFITGFLSFSLIFSYFYWFDGKE